MKRSVVIFTVLLCWFINGWGQSIQYSKGSFKVDERAQAQLVSNLEGYHHVITFSYYKKPIIHIFDDHLRLVQERELDFPIRRDCDVAVVPFDSYYYLTIHVFEPSLYEVWKVDKQGKLDRMSKQFAALFDTVFRDRPPVLQLMNFEGKLFALAQSYLDPIKSIRCKVVCLDDYLTTLKETTVAYPFDKEGDLLQQVSLSNDALFVLKSAKASDGNSLTVMKVELETGDVLTTLFNTGHQANLNPGFIFNAKDSSLLVFSTLVQSDVDRRMQRSILVSRLDNQLKEQTPVTLLKHQFSQNTGSNFVFVEGDTPVWLNVFINRRTPVPVYRVSASPPTNYRIRMPYMNYANPGDNYYLGPTGVRLTVVDSQFKTRSDSVVSNDKKMIELQSYPFGQFTIGKKVYLVLTQSFTAKRKGLIMFTSDDKGKLVDTGLPVFDKYDYVLPQLQACDDYFVVPYSYRNEMGLMKVTVKD